jgi:hypothetical protein
MTPKRPVRGCLRSLPSPPKRGRGVGGEGVFFRLEAASLTPTPLPPKRGERGFPDSLSIWRGFGGTGEPSPTARSIHSSYDTLFSRYGLRGRPGPRPAAPPRPLTSAQKGP